MDMLRGSTRCRVQQWEAVVLHGTEVATSGAEGLRHALVDQLCAHGTVRSGPVEAALRAVPRHVFLPRVEVEQAYADQAVDTKYDDAGWMISAASQPTIVAMMLEQAQVPPGARVLEIGAGTGYNAALLAHLVGDSGQVTTIDVDEDLVAGARSALEAAGFPEVRVLLGDGALGDAVGGPDDLIIATVGIGDLQPAWLEQIVEGGRLVVPMRLRGSVSRSMVFEAVGGRWRSVESRMCSFTPLRKAGIADDPRRIVDLTGEGTARLELWQEQTPDVPALTGVLNGPRTQRWTGVGFGAAESAEWLWLWLACTLDNAVSRVFVDQTAIDREVIVTQFGWGVMATTDHADLAYLTMRPAQPPQRVTGELPAGQERRFEVGVIAHGPHRDDLAATVATQIRTWDRDHRTHTAHIDVAPLAQQATPAPDQFAFTTARNQLVISWV
jgi:protein-L-isoaspartate(D-aspartate) O-methyltransferase